ncbi:DUF397 domain-containing protein [Streptomyces sp. SID10815]|uniref:DUF397 domain-containing protein n=1 Tax=Streptomyces sp. SID10815 TaxID=2706027 RepID=UPI0013C8DA2B|nr:DUF397 domain-containing protein [Streptomyces sp. SID10815]NEA51597.1 DUF397 domain-containing protein [Streptomyces sp. SID10815]
MAQPSTVRVGHEGTKLTWRKSSYSDHNGDCVELAELGEVVAFRDSKRIQGPVVSVDRWTLETFVAALVNGHMSTGRP